MRVIYNTFLALAFIHEANVMHRDFKPANILLNSDCTVKISDFGLSRTIPQTIMDNDGFNTLHVRQEY